MFNGIRRFHLIGIGGIGMSGLAELLLRLQYEVSGSDLKRSPVTDRLGRLGATIYEGHDAAHLGPADVVVYSAAIRPENPELSAARERGVFTVTRADLLAEFLRGRYGIAVAGTHGKTTTTAMIGLTFLEAGLDPTLIVGGIVREIESNARLGHGPYVVAEADEFDQSFLHLSPTVAVITNVEADHLDCYGTLDAIERAFTAFANTVPMTRPVVVCGDDDGVRRIVPQIRRRRVTYGLSAGVDVHADDIRLDGLRAEFTVQAHGAALGRIRLRIPGRHNITNALAAVAVGQYLAIPFERTRAALERFTGVERRFEIKGERGGITVVDDYAHHPTEIEATLRGIADGTGRRIIAIFQPHLYTRTRDFADAFGRALAQAHTTVVTDIYPAREAPIPGVTGDLVAQAARRHGGQDVLYIPEKDAVAGRLADRLQPGDIVMTLGAGDIAEVGDALLRLLDSTR
ncbi:MAG: UDP-N-acetylmuramate--L-alanine ligase [Candidatus Latescibacteria bacterium]|nr:UDP-N-acetylmuramate--L-alanine ligase [Candidatus Latescibacterota bacterium]